MVNKRHCRVKSSNAPTDVIHNLIGMATSGISISDFRNVNSLQRFLEIRVRQSPRYKNLVKGLFDVNLDYDELMMPENEIVEMDDLIRYIR